MLASSTECALLPKSAMFTGLISWNMSSFCVNQDIEFMERRIEDLEKSMKRSNDKQLKIEHELSLRVCVYCSSSFGFFHLPKCLFPFLYLFRLSWSLGCRDVRRWQYEVYLFWYNRLTFSNFKLTRCFSTIRYFYPPNNRNICLKNGFPPHNILCMRMGTDIGKDDWLSISDKISWLDDFS